MVALLFKLNTIIAPIIEEISFRGIIFEEAKPLGSCTVHLANVCFCGSPWAIDTGAMDGLFNPGALLMVVRLVTKSYNIQ